MPFYDITDNETGDTLTVEGDAPPSEQDVIELFASRKKSTPQIKAPKQMLAPFEADAFQPPIPQSEFGTPSAPPEKIINPSSFQQPTPGDLKKEYLQSSIDELRGGSPVANAVERAVDVVTPTVQALGPDMPRTLLGGDLWNYAGLQNPADTFGRLTSRAAQTGAGVVADIAEGWAPQEYQEDIKPSAPLLTPKEKSILGRWMTPEEMDGKDDLTPMLGGFRNAKAALKGEPLPILKTIEGVGGWREGVARGSIGLTDIAGRILLMRGMGAAGNKTLLADPRISGALAFGGSEQGFSSIGAIEGALIPGMMQAGKSQAASVLKKLIENGTLGAKSRFTQKAIEEASSLAYMEAFMMAKESPELIHLAETNPEEFKVRLIEKAITNLGFAAHGLIGSKGRPSETQMSMFRDAVKREISRSAKPDEDLYQGAAQDLLGNDRKLTRTQSATVNRIGEIAKEFGITEDAIRVIYDSENGVDDNGNIVPLKTGVAARVEGKHSENIQAPAVGALPGERGTTGVVFINAAEFVGRSDAFIRAKLAHEWLGHERTETGNEKWSDYKASVEGLIPQKFKDAMMDLGYSPDQIPSEFIANMWQDKINRGDTAFDRFLGRVKDLLPGNRGEKAARAIIREVKANEEQRKLLVENIKKSGMTRSDQIKAAALAMAGKFKLAMDYLDNRQELGAKAMIDQGSVGGAEAGRRAQEGTLGLPVDFAGNDIVPGAAPSPTGRDLGGGRISFAGEAEAKGVPSARQQAQEPPQGFQRTAEDVLAARKQPSFEEQALAGMGERFAPPPYRVPSTPEPTRRLNAAQRRAALEAEMRREVEQPPVEPETGTYPEGAPGSGAMSRLQRQRELRRIEKIEEGKSPGNIRMPGERFSRKSIEEMTDDQISRKISAWREITGNNQPHAVGVEMGLDLTEADVPALREMQKESNHKMMEAMKSKDSEAQIRAFNRNLVIGGAIEGALKKGPNYDIYVKEKEAQNAIQKRSAEEVPVRETPPDSEAMGKGVSDQEKVAAARSQEKDILTPEKSERHVLPVLVTESGAKYPGSSHADALARAKKLREEGKISKEEYADVAVAMMDDSSHKFVDSSGRLMDRAEAGEFTGLEKELQSETAKMAGMLLPPNTFGERFSRGKRDNGDGEDLTRSKTKGNFKYEEQASEEKTSKGGEVSKTGSKSIDEIRAEESKVAQDILDRARKDEIWNRFEVEISPGSAYGKSNKIKSIIEGTLHGLGLSDIAESESGVKIIHDFVIDKRLHHFAKTFLETGEAKFYDKEIYNSVLQFVNSRLGKARLTEIPVDEFSQNIEELSLAITGRKSDDPASIAMIAEIEAAFDRFTEKLPEELRQLVDIRMIDDTVAYRSAREAYIRKHKLSDSSFAKRINKVAMMMLEDTILKEILLSSPSEKKIRAFESKAIESAEKKKLQDKAYYLKKASSSKKSEKYSLNKVEDVFKHPKASSLGIGRIASDSLESFRTGLASKFRPIDKLAQDIAKAYGVKTPKGLSGIFEAIKGATGKAEADVYRFDRDVYKLIKGNELDFNAYMFANRGIDRLTQDAADAARAASARSQLPVLRSAVRNAPSRQAQVAALRTYKQTLETARIKPRRMVGNFTIPELRSALQQLEAKLGPDKMDKMRQASDNFQKHMDDALRLQVESGRMSQAVYNAIKSGNIFYAPFKLSKYVEMTNRPDVSGSRIDTTVDYTRAMEGIESIDFKLSDILAASRQAIVTSRILADKNNAMRKLADLAAFDVNGTFIKKLKTGEHPPERMMAVNVMELGKKYKYAVNPDVARAIEIHGKATQEGLSRFLALFASPFRAGATALNIPFQVSNLLADTPRAALVSKYGIRSVNDAIMYPWDFFHSLYSSITGDVIGLENKLFLDFLDSGTAGVTVQEHFTPSMMRYRPSTMTGKAKSFGKDVLFSLPHFAAAIEQTSKILGVKRAMRFHGVTSGKELAERIPEAITEIRRFSGSPDFGRQGRWVEQARLNLLFMFLNARIQGTTADLSRLFGADGAKRSAITWTRLLTAVGIPTILLSIFNRKEHEEDLKKIPERDRSNYWIVFKGDDKFIKTDDGEVIKDYWKIPKRESSKWVANSIEAAMDFYWKRDPENMKKFAETMIEEVSPLNIQGESLQERFESSLSSINPILKAGIETATGRDMYRHRNIVPEMMKEGNTPELQYRKSTPAIFIKAADALPDIAPDAMRSPIMLEHLVKTMTAGLITQFIKKRDIEGRKDWEGNPLLARFQASPFSENKELEKQLKRLKGESVDDRIIRSRAIESVMDSHPNANPAQVVMAVMAEYSKVGNPDERLVRQTVDLWIAKKNGVTYQEKSIIALPVEQRAKYVKDLIAKTPPMERRQVLIDLVKKRILTESVAEEMGNAPEAQE